MEQITLKDLYRAVRRDAVFRRKLTAENLSVVEPAFNQALLEEVDKVFSIDYPLYGEPWSDLVKCYGEPKNTDFLSRDLFCAFVETNNWLSSIRDYVTDQFEEEVCSAFCLMWSYLYDRFGATVMDVVGDLADDEAAEFYEMELCPEN